MRARLLFAAIFALICLPVLLLPADSVRLEVQAVQASLSDFDRDDLTALEVDWPGGDAEGRATKMDALRAALKIGGEVAITDSAEGVLRVPINPDGAEVYRMQVQIDDNWLLLVGSEGEPALLHRDKVTDATTEASPQRLGSRMSLLPPLLAIMLAFLTQAILPSLLFGVLAGIFLMQQPGNGVADWFTTLFQETLWGQILTDDFKLYILGFVLVLSSTVAILTRMGGIEGMVRSLLRFAKNSRSVQTVAYAMGLGIFFDDYANTIIVGNSCGPLFDKMKISRAKLAYIVDSTAAPVAGVALLSTWVAYQISTFAPQLPTVGMAPEEGYSLFLQTIPYRFYCLLALGMVAMVIYTQRDFGPMRKVEEAARSGDGGADPSAMKMDSIEPAPGVRPRWQNGLFPILLMIFGTFALILWSGASALAADGIDGGSGFAWVRAVLGKADSTWAIFWGSMSALALAALLAISQKQLSTGEVTRTATSGLTVLFKDAVLVLILAWSIGYVCQSIGTAGYLVAVFQDLISPAILPVILFMTACFVAFATGSSWTTMAILQPNVVLLAYTLGEASDIGGPALLIMSIGAVLEGAIFGDHCSPISDTTVLSSTASKCLHIDHVRTQAPYAMVTAFAAITCAYLPVGLFGWSPWIGLALGMTALALFLRVVGRRPGEGASAQTATS